MLLMFYYHYTPEERGLLNHPNHINTRASKFTKDDVEALKVRFQPASEDHVIPNEKVEEFPEKYECPKISRDMIDKGGFKVREIRDFSDSRVQTFFYKLHIATRSQAESKTDDMVADLLRIARLNDYPLYIEQHPSNKLHILGEPYLSATPEFVVNKETMAMVITEDKTLQNADPASDFGEMQIAGEILACGSENTRRVGKIADQVLYSIRFISTYTTFYKAEIPAGYWDELAKGLPTKNSIEIKRWPGENEKKSGLDIADPNGRKAVLTALTKIRQFLLNQ